MPKLPTPNRYLQLVEKIFFDRYRKGDELIEFTREDLVSAAKEIGIVLPKNLGDVIYSIRYRTRLPASILETQQDGKEWIIEGMGRALYAFRLVKENRILPNFDLVTTKIPDATPEIVTCYALSDEQALLAKVRYNRLIDIFLGITTYSLQNHLRTTVSGVGQIEIDEIYVGVDKQGRQFVIPVQAKGGKDQIAVVQAKHDILCCAEKYPDLICRPISAQFMSDDVIAIFELCLEKNEVKIVDERHYLLVSSSDISPDELRRYSQR